MIRPGEITNVRNGMIQVTFCRPDACEKCVACEGGKKQTAFWIKGSGCIGDIAMVEMPEKMIINASAIAYGMPLLLLITGLVIGSVLAPGNETAGVIGAAIGLAVSLGMLKLTEPLREGKKGWVPVVREIIKKEPDTASTESIIHQ